MIAHYHWQVGLVADGRLLAAAAAPSSDTAQELTCAGSHTAPHNHPPSRFPEFGGSGRSGASSMRPRPRSGAGPGVGRRPGEEGNQDASPTSSLFSCFCSLLPHRNLKGHGHSTSDFPIAQPWQRGCRPYRRGLRPFPLARSSSSAAVRPSSLLLLKCLQIQKRFRNAFRLREPEDLG